MFRLRRTSRNYSGRFDIVVITLIALFLVAGLIYVLLQIVGHSEEHVEKVRNTKVTYKESLSWRPDTKVAQQRIRNDLGKDRKVAEYHDLTLDEECVELIGRMSKLEKVNLDRTKLEDSWLEHLVPLRLRSLSVEGNPLTDKAIPYILKMQNLRSLSIGDTELTNKGLEQLSASQSLNTLKLNLARSVTNDGIKHVGMMKQLTEFQLTNPQNLTGKCLTHLTNLKNLHTLSLENIPLAPDDIGTLSGLKKLSTLDISNNRLKDPSMREVAKITSLTTLDLTGSNMTGNGLMLLTKLPRLAFLRLKDCPDVDRKALEKFRLAMPTCLVEHTRTDSMSEKMSRKDVKLELDFLQEEVRQELEKSKKVEE